MECFVTAGPTYEPLDAVRRLTNFSTGKLGIDLANFLAQAGHRVTLLRSESATYRGTADVAEMISFGRSIDLAQCLEKFKDRPIAAVFHAAAVSDFEFGKIWRRSASGAWIEVESRKLSTRDGALLAELVPTSKILARLRDWFPTARLVGWKYDVDGDRARVLALAKEQMRESRTDACVANGPAYGDGFGLMLKTGATTHLKTAPELFQALGELLARAVQ